jgi:hypothetical protein
MDILGGLREDGYAFTHLLMYCTDFGFRRGPLPRRRSVILGEASSLLAKCLDTEDYDLAGEVLLAWPFTGARWSASAAFSFRVLARIEDHIGVVPGGTTKADRLHRLDGHERLRYALGTAYHTAYVMGFICAAALLPGRAPPITLTGRPIKESFVQRLQPYLDPDQGHWQTEWSGLTTAEHTALAPLMLDIAIAQKCRKREYEAVHDVLVLALDYDMASSSLCAQAAELLQRLAACAHAIQRKPRTQDPI